MTLQVNASTAATAASRNSADYTVRSGDNLSSIARRHGVSLQALLGANPQLRDPNLIHAGQRVHIPHGTTNRTAATTATDGRYTVKRGDTMAGIAQAHSLSLDALRAANPQIRDFNRIYPGQSVTIPGREANGASHAGRGLGTHAPAAPVTHGGLDATTLSARLASTASKPTLRQGASGQSVRELQQRLTQLGFNPGPVDGAFGPRTDAAVRGFQRSQGIAVDGVVGPQTWGKLANPSSGTTGTAPAPATSGYPTLRQGASGQAVRNLQQRLSQLGFNPGPVDGAFGPRTDAAVRAFQRNQGIAVDGVVGPQTWGKLANPSSGTGTPPPSSGGRGTAGLFVDRALAQEGDRYVYGAETNLNDPNPGTFDCSELVQWAAHQAGGYMPDGSANQEAYCRQKGTIISVNEALHTRGALLFKDGHVAISLGDGVHTIEAMGSRWGVLRADGRNRFRCGGLVPDMRY